MPPLGPRGYDQMPTDNIAILNFAHGILRAKIKRILGAICTSKVSNMRRSGHLTLRHLTFAGGQRLPA